MEDGSDVYQNKYSQEVNSKHRYKRGVDPAKVTCELYMQADHLYYEKYYSNVDTVIEKLTQHVQAINNIFPAVGEYVTLIFIQPVCSIFICLSLSIIYFVSALHFL